MNWIVGELLDWKPKIFSWILHLRRTEISYLEEGELLEDRTAFDPSEMVYILFKNYKRTNGWTELMP